MSVESVIRFNPSFCFCLSLFSISRYLSYPYSSSILAVSKWAVWISVAFVNFSIPSQQSLASCLFSDSFFCCRPCSTSLTLRHVLVLCRIRFIISCRYVATLSLSHAYLAGCLLVSSLLFTSTWDIFNNTIDQIVGARWIEHFNDPSQ